MLNTANKSPETELTTSIIVPTIRGRDEYLKMLLSSLLKANIPTKSCEIIVVCDRADEKIKQTVKNFQDYEKYPIILIKNKEKVGASRARNIGFRKSKGKLLVFFDDDVIVHPNYFKHVTKDFAENKRVGCVVGRSLIPPFRTVPEKSTSLLSLVKKGKLHDGGLSGSNMSFSRTLFEKLGGFDENLGLYTYFEDMDIFMRVKSAGNRLVHDVEAIVIHFKAPFGGVEGSGLGLSDHIYYNTRNVTYVYLKNEVWPLCLLKAIRTVNRRFKFALRRRKIDSDHMLKAILFKIPKGFIDAYLMYLIYNRQRKL